MALHVVQRGNEARMVRSMPQLNTMLERHCKLDATIEKGLDIVTAAEMVQYLKAKIQEIETMV